MTSGSPLFSDRDSLRLAGMAGLLAAGIAVLVLTGWVYGLSALKSIRPEWVSMKANTAIGLLLAGGSLRLKTAETPNMPLARIGGILVGLLGAATGLEYLTGIDTGIDQWLFRENPVSPDTLSPNRMAPATAVLFMLIGLALVLDHRDTRNHRRIAWLTLAGAPLLLLPGVALLLDVHSLFGLGRYIQLAMPSVIAGLLLLAGLLMAQPGHGLVAALRSPSIRGHILRRTLPVAVAAPLCLGAIQLTAAREHWIDPDFGILLLATAYVLILSALFIWTSNLRAQRERDLAAANERASRLLGESDVIRTALTETVNRYRKTLEELGASEMRFHQIFKSSPLGIAVLDIRLNRFTAVNPRYCEMMARSEEELLANDWRLVTPPDDMAASAEFIARFANGEIISGEIQKRFLRGDGGILWGRLHVTRLPNPVTGEPENLAIVEDITTRKQMEATLRQLSLAVDQSSGTIVMTDPEARIIYANPAFTRTTGYALEEAIGRNPRILQSGKTPPGVFVDLWAHLTRGDAWRGELINRRKDGTEYIESAIISPVRDEQNALTGYIAIKDDITEHKRLLAEQERLGRLYAMRSAASRALVYSHSETELLAAVFTHIASMPTIPMAFIAMTGDGAPRYRITHLHGIPSDMQPALLDILADPGCQIGREMHDFRPGRAFTIDVPKPGTGPYAGKHERWESFLNEHGIQGEAVVPLFREGHLIGIITVFTHHAADAFDSREVALLHEMSADIAFGLNAMALNARRLAAEAQATLSEHRFEEVFESSPIPMQIHSLQTRRIRAINRSHRDWLGYALEDIDSEERWMARVFPDADYRQGVWAAWGAAIPEAQDKQGVVRSPEMVMTGRDGAHHTVCGAMTIVGDDMIVIWHDLTDIRRHEQALLESERRFRTMIEQTVVGIYVQRDGRFLYVNPRLATVFGRAPEDFVGRELMDFTPQEPANVADILHARERIHRTGEIVTGVVPAIRADGSRFALSLTAKEIVWDDGLPATIVMAEDITKRKQAEDRIARYIRRLEGSMKATLQAVSNMVELRDPYTAGHERRVGLIARDIAREMGWDEARCAQLELTGLVHDIGKIAVPSEILSKPARLTPLEMALIKNHPQAGYDILKDIEFSTPVAEIILQHHERLDGSGYPRGLKGEAILPEARIVAVADVLESMASHRPYRPALGMEAALAELERGRESHYDPAVVDCLLRMVREKGYVLPG